MRALLVTTCLLLSACSGDAEPAGRETPATTAAPEYPCPNQEAVIEDASLRTGNPGSGDLDGDGEAESVAIHFDPQGAPGCEAFVVAESAERILSGPLETWRAEFGLPMPTLNGLYDLDEERGDEVVVNMGAGASTQFVGIVVEEAGALVQVTTEVPGQPVAGMFGFGGSVGHMEAVDCARPGAVVASIATPEGEVYKVDRRTYRFSGAEMIQDSRDVERVPVEDVDRFPEYAASPFGSCS